MSGYSGTPLARKLGIKEGFTVAAVGEAPDDLIDLLAPLPPGVRWKKTARAPLDMVIAFFTRRADVARRWTGLTAAAGPEGVVTIKAGSTFIAGVPMKVATVWSAGRRKSVRGGSTWRARPASITATRVDMVMAST